MYYIINVWLIYVWFNISILNLAIMLDKIDMLLLKYMWLIYILRCILNKVILTCYKYVLR